MRSELLSSAPREAAAVLIAGRSTAEGRSRLLVREVIPIPREHYLIQEELRVSISPLFLAPLIKRARLEGWSLVLAHSHPFGDPVSFSHVDDVGEARLMPTFFLRAPDRPHATLVVGRSSFDARVRYTAADEHQISTIAEVGSDLRLHEKRDLEVSVDEGFDRSIRAFGAKGQSILRRLKFGIVGLGGTGSIVAEQLAYLGVGSLVLLDPDTIERTNLNRVVGSSADTVGRAKTDVAAEHVERIRRDTKIVSIRGTVLRETDASALLACDLIACCTDSQGSRAVLNQLAYQYLIPTVDMGVRIDAGTEGVTSIAGRVQLLAPGLPCLLCQRLLDPEEVRRDLLSDTERQKDPYILGAPLVEPQPSVISINGTVASLAVTMLLAVAVGIPSLARHQIYRGVEGLVRRVAGPPVPNCVVCSRHGALARGDLWSLPWRKD